MESIDPLGSADCFIWSFNYSVIWLMLFPPASVWPVHSDLPSRAESHSKNMKATAPQENEQHGGRRLEKWKALAVLDVSLYTSLPNRSNLEVVTFSFLHTFFIFCLPFSGSSHSPVLENERASVVN